MVTIIELWKIKMNDPKFIEYLDSFAKGLFCIMFFFSSIAFVLYFIFRFLQYCGIVQL